MIIINQLNQNEKNIMKEIQIPFQGFYDSIHSFNIDSILEYDIEDLPLDQAQAVSEDFSFTEELLNGYCKLYLESVESELNTTHNPEIKLEFKELISPREYNFDTDRLFAHISDYNIISLFDRVDKECLSNLIKKRCTSYDGFISFYSNDINEWPKNVLDWDSIQLGFILDVLLYENEDFELYSLNNCDGEISELVWEAYSEQSKELIEQSIT